MKAYNFSNRNDNLFQFYQIILAELFEIFFDIYFTMFGKYILNTLHWKYFYFLILIEIRNYIRIYLFRKLQILIFK